jgi:hypothetical protein
MTPNEDFFMHSMELVNINSEVKYSSLYLVEQINLFRSEEGNTTKVRHSDLLSKIEKRFESKIAQRKISLSEYKDSTNRALKKYELPFEYCLRILMDESEIVQDRCVEVMKTQQREIEKLSTPKTYKEALLALIHKEEEKEQLLLQVDNLSTALDSLVEWFSIIKVSTKNKIKESTFDWRQLKTKSKEMGYAIKKAASPRFEFQNLYHVNVFKACYPQFNYNLLD